jgi:hypothetical protein
MSDTEDDDGPEVPAPRGPGRPEHVPDNRTRATVQVMYANGMSRRTIAKAIGCDPRTLTKHYRAQLEDAHDQVEAAMGVAIVASARQGAWGAARYWLQTHSKDDRWRTPEPHSIAGNPNGPPIRVELENMTEAEIVAELETLRERRRMADGTRALAETLPKRSNGMGH